MAGIIQKRLTVSGAPGAQPLLLFSWKGMKHTFCSIIPLQARLLIGTLASVFKEVCNGSLAVRRHRGRSDFTSRSILPGNFCVCCVGSDSQEMCAVAVSGGQAELLFEYRAAASLRH